MNMNQFPSVPYNYNDCLNCSIRRPGERVLGNDGRKTAVPVME